MGPSSDNFAAVVIYPPHEDECLGRLAPHGCAIKNCRVRRIVLLAGKEKVRECAKHIGERLVNQDDGASATRPGGAERTSGNQYPNTNSDSGAIEAVDNEGEAQCPASEEPAEIQAENNPNGKTKLATSATDDADMSCARKSPKGNLAPEPMFMQTAGIPTKLNKVVCEDPATEDSDISPDEEGRNLVGGYGRANVF